MILWIRIKIDARCDRSPSNRKIFIVVHQRQRVNATLQTELGHRPLWSRDSWDITPHGMLSWMSFRLHNMAHIHTELTEKLKLRVPVVMGGMQWVGTPRLAAAVSNAGALGIITALTQPSPAALKDAIQQTRSMIEPEIARERTPLGAFGVNITLLPAIVPPDYDGYVRAALEAGVRIFETAGSNRACTDRLMLTRSGPCDSCT